MECVAAASVVLGLVEGDIGTAEEGFQVDIRLGDEDDTDARPSVDGVAVDRNRVGLTGLRPSALPHHRTCGFPHPAVEPSGLSPQASTVE
jgi:hypothetical protein